MRDGSRCFSPGQPSPADLVVPHQNRGLRICGATGRDAHNAQRRSPPDSAAVSSIAAWLGGDRGPSPPAISADQLGSSLNERGVRGKVRIFGAFQARLPDPPQFKIGFRNPASQVHEVGSCPRYRVRKTLDLFISAGLRSQRHGKPMPARIQASGGFSRRRAGAGTASRIAAIGVALPRARHL